MHHTSVVTIDLVRHAVDFDARADTLADRDDMEATPEDRQPTLELVQAIDVGCDAHSVDLDPIILRTETVSLHRVETPAMAQRQNAPDLAAHLWTAAGRGCVELGLLNG